uniref:G-protein coupled receptors family 3 profile domain-containing protein n=1 Tax=Xenopus tropicalis TaxID=8364 RepID=A0A803JIK4_XENTR
MAPFSFRRLDGMMRGHHWGRSLSLIPQPSSGSQEIQRFPSRCAVKVVLLDTGKLPRKANPSAALIVFTALKAKYPTKQVLYIIHWTRVLDSSNCFPCTDETWPNEGRTECLPKPVDFLSFEEPLGITITCTTIFSYISTVTILCVFIRYKDTAIVKANNRDLTYVLLGSLSLSFLCPLLFIGQPHRFTCLFRQVTFGVIFVLSVSCVLAKTIMVVIAFRATKPGSNMRRWLGPSVPGLKVSACTNLQLFICIFWMLYCPPFPERNTRIKIGVIVFQCNECSDTLLWCMVGCMAFLSCVCFLVAFLARKLPDTFNEAKWITFSMLIFLSVWIAFAPAYLSTQGKYMAAVEVFGIICSSAGILVCIFLPKCYIILLRPDLNTRGNILSNRST